MIGENNSIMKEHVHDENCNHDHEIPMITITMDDNSEVNCIVVDIFEFNGKEYIALLPDEDSEVEEEIFILNYVEDGEEVDLSEIEDEDEFNEVSAHFQEIFEQGLELE